MIKALFFDIDGTLVSFKTHKIPLSAVESLREAKKHGIKILISTGRPYSIINNLQQIDDLIDGYITTNGAYCFIGKKVVCCNPISSDNVKTMIRLADEMNFACMVVGENKHVVYNSNELVDKVFVDMLNVHNLNENGPIAPVLKQRILQLTPFITVEQERTVLPLISGCIAGRWHPSFADITSVYADKGKGLVAMAESLNLKISETMAFGDGGNDISILCRAGIGVAMGNADDNVKSNADYVTDAIDNDGIKKALDKFL